MRDECQAWAGSGIHCKPSKNFSSQGEAGVTYPSEGISETFVRQAADHRVAESQARLSTHEQEQQASDKGAKVRRERPGNGERGTLPGRWQGHQRWAWVGAQEKGPSAGHSRQQRGQRAGVKLARDRL